MHKKSKSTLTRRSSLKVVKLFLDSDLKMSFYNSTPPQEHILLFRISPTFYAPNCLDFLRSCAAHKVLKVLHAAVQQQETDLICACESRQTNAHTCVYEPYQSFMEISIMLRTHRDHGTSSQIEKYHATLPRR